MSTYMDPIFLAEFPREFGGLIAHVNRPPSGVNVEQPGVPVGALRVASVELAGRGPRRHLTAAGYVGALRDDLAQRGRHLVEPSLLEQHFKVLFREARYLYPRDRPFDLTC